MKEQFNSLRNHYRGKLNIINTRLADENIQYEERDDLEIKESKCEAAIKKIKKTMYTIRYNIFYRRYCKTIKRIISK